MGISALREGTTDIAMASRRMKFDERMKLQAAGHPPVEVTVAFDALAVVVNPANRSRNLRANSSKQFSAARSRTGKK